MTAGHLGHPFRLVELPFGKLLDPSQQALRFCLGESDIRVDSIGRFMLGSPNGHMLSPSLLQQRNPPQNAVSSLAISLRKTHLREQLVSFDMAGILPQKLSQHAYSCIIRASCKEMARTDQLFGWIHCLLSVVWMAAKISTGKRKIGRPERWQPLPLL